MKRTFISLCFLCAGLSVAAQGIHFSNSPRRDPMREEMSKLANAVLAITSLYVDTVDNKKLVGRRSAPRCHSLMSFLRADFMWGVRYFWLMRILNSPFTRRKRTRLMYMTRGWMCAVSWWA